MVHFVSAIVVFISTNPAAIRPLSKMVANRFLGQCYAKQIRVGMTHEEVTKLVRHPGYPKAGTNSAQLQEYSEYGFLIFYRRDGGSMSVGKVSLRPPPGGREVRDIIKWSRR